jgi:hypothetical protein
MVYLVKNMFRWEVEQFSTNLLFSTIRILSKIDWIHQHSIGEQNILMLSKIYSYVKQNNEIYSTDYFTNFMTFLLTTKRRPSHAPDTGTRQYISPQKEGHFRDFSHPGPLAFGQGS